MSRDAHKGFTLIEVLVGLGVLTIVSSALYSAYGSVLQIIQSSQYNSAALSIIESHVETVRNMRYEDVGTVNGVPAGKLTQTETVTLDNTQFALHTYVRNIDDPFDGTLGGSPNDTAPADYKLVQFQVTCDTCTRYNLISMATYVAPKNLESSSRNGNLFIRVFDADGHAVTGATVHVTNTKVTPHIDLTDITNSAGMLQLVDTATTSAGYHITVTKSGYTSDQTYPPGSPPNPLQPDATVATQQLTITSLSIDRASTLSLRTRDQFCQAVPGVDFLLTGGKLIGTNPNTPKYSVGQVTNASGGVTVNPLEWDSYAIKPTDTAFDIAGQSASLSFIINPNVTQSVTLLVASKSASGILVKVTDSGGMPLDDATVQLTKTGFSATRTTGRSTITQTDWSGGQYDSKSALMNTNGTPGTLTLTAVGGVYASTSEWLISRTFDMGSTSAQFYDLTFNPAGQPPQTTMSIQVAGNNDNTTWNWVGPDGTPATSFTTPGQMVPASLTGKQYLRYKVSLATNLPQVAPTLTDLDIAFRSGCLLSGQAYINGLSNGTYTLSVTRAGYQPSSTQVTVSSGWQSVTITLVP